MIKKIVLLISIFISITTAAQLKKITLDEAVLQQNRAFRADKMLAFQWIPNTNKYSYCTDNYTKILSANTKENKPTELATLAEINSALGTKLKNFFGITFIDANTILASENGKYFSYNLLTKKGDLMHESSESAENQTLNSNKTLLAFTQENNLYYYNSKQGKVAITSNSDKNIVSGQTISRSEFGINGGIFWSPKSSYIAFYQKDETEVADYPIVRHHRNSREIRHQ